MAQAQGIARVISRVKQSGKGAAGSTGSQRIRRTSATFNKTSDTFENNEIVDHQQSTGATEGVYSTTGQVDGLISPGTYTPEFANLLRKDFVATSSITGLSVTIAASGSGYTITRASGDFLTGGIKIGDIVRLAGAGLDSANVAVNLLVTAVTSTVLTVFVLNGSSLTTEGPISSVTVSVPGKKAWVPTSGHTNDYFSYEIWQSEVPSSELYVDCKTGQAQISVPATGNSTVSFTIPGLSRVLGTSQVLTSPTAATTTDVVSSAKGAVVINGVSTPITTASVTVNGNINQGEAEVGSQYRSDHQRGRVAVNGSFSAKFTSTTLQAIREAQTTVSLVIALPTNATGSADFVTLVIPSLKIMTDSANDGEVEIIRQYDFTAQLNKDGGAALSSLQTIFSMQDSQA